MSLRSLARGAAEVVITGTGTARIARRLHRSSVAILAYHNVVAPEEAGRGDTSLHLPFPRFADQIARVMKTHDVISLEDLHTAPRGGRPRAVITFDDAYRGAVTLALPELRRLGIPAVMFVSPGMLGTRSTWWDEFGAAGKLSAAVRDDALTRLAGRRDLVSNVEVRAIARGALPASYGIATREELLNACAADIAIGSHAWDHEYLPALNDTALRETLRRAREWIDANAPLKSDWIALPYGGGGDAVSRTALEAGHAGVLMISGGVVKDAIHREAVPRINIPAGMSRRGLEIRVSGIDFRR